VGTAVWVDVDTDVPRQELLDLSPLRIARNKLNVDHASPSQ